MSHFEEGTSRRSDNNTGINGPNNRNGVYARGEQIDSHDDMMAGNHHTRPPYELFKAK